MRRILASAIVALPVAASVAACLIGLGSSASAQMYDPGWRIVYTGQANYGGGLIENVFGDNVDQVAVPPAYAPPPSYYQQAPAARPPVYQPAPAYYPQPPAPPSRAYAPAPTYYQQAPSYPQAPVYQQAPAAPQPRAYQPAPVYYQQVPAPQQRAYQPAPASYQQTPAPQPRVDQPAAALRQGAPVQRQRTDQPAPSYYAAPAPQARGFQPTATASYQTTQAPPQQQGISFPFFQSFLFAPASQHPAYQQPAPQQSYARNEPASGYGSSTYGDMAHAVADPQYERQVVDYQGSEKPGTIIIDTPHFFLYLVLEGGKALRYGIGVGRPGFTWAGVKEVSAMREWPDWRPPIDMLERRPDLPRYMPGGPENPLGARALYLGSTLYRIHGSNEPWTIGTQVSSGCIRLRNADIIDLYGRVKVGTKVIVI